MKKQGYNARKDEQLGMTRGKKSGKKNVYGWSKKSSESYT